MPSYIKVFESILIVSIALTGSPVFPCGPCGPGIPGAPMSPFCPGSPLTPGRPMSPLSPGSPLAPSSTDGSGGGPAVWDRVRPNKTSKCVSGCSVGQGKAQRNIYMWFMYTLKDI